MSTKYYKSILESVSKVISNKDTVINQASNSQENIADKIQATFDEALTKWIKENKEYSYTWDAHSILSLEEDEEFINKLFNTNSNQYTPKDKFYDEITDSTWSDWEDIVFDIVDDCFKDADIDLTELENNGEIDKADRMALIDYAKYEVYERVPFDDGADYLASKVDLNVGIYSKTEIDWNHDIDNDDLKTLEPLIKSQGKTLDEFKEFYKAYIDADSTSNKIKNDGKFFRSLAKELDGAQNGGLTLVFGSHMTLQEAFDLYEDSTIKVSSDCKLIGLVDEMNGSGGTLEIELEKPIELNRKDYIIAPEARGSRRTNIGYSIDYIYGLTPEAWGNKNYFI